MKKWRCCEVHFAPGARQLSLSPGRFQAESDDQGRFVFEHLPPGELQVCRMVHNKYSGVQYVEVAAGKPTVIRHGFNGRLLKGRFVASERSTNPNWKAAQMFNFSTKMPQLEPPKGEDARTWQQK